MNHEWVWFLKIIAFLFTLIQIKRIPTLEIIKRKKNVKLNHKKFASVISLGRNKQFSVSHDYYNHSNLAISYKKYRSRGGLIIYICHLWFLLKFSVGNCFEFGKCWFSDHTFARIYSHPGYICTNKDRQCSIICP